MVTWIEFKKKKKKGKELNGHLRKESLFAKYSIKSFSSKESV